MHYERVTGGQTSCQVVP